MGARLRPGSAAQDDNAARWYLLFILAAFLLLLARLFVLQVVQQRAHFKAGLDNVLRSVTIPPPRGTIYDRAGKPLAVSKQTFGLLFIPPANIETYLPDEKQRRVINVASINYDYLQRVSYDKDPQTHKTSRHQPRAELIERNLPADVRSALNAWNALLPVAPEIEACRNDAIGPFNDDLGPLDLETVLTYTGDYANFAVVSSTVYSYLNSQGQGQSYARDWQLLTSRATDAAHKLFEPPDQSKDKTPAPSAELRAKQQLDLQGKLADLLTQLYTDEQTLAALYCEEAALSGSDVSALRLDEIALLGSFLGKSYGDLMYKLSGELGKGYGPHPLMIADELTSDQKLYIGEHNAQFPHEIIEQYSFKREYPLGTASTHLLGYVGAASPEQVGSGYDPQEDTGKLGVEFQFEDQLRGQLGRRDMEIDRHGVFKAETGVDPPKRGSDLYLSIDSGTQAAAHRIVSQTMNDTNATGGAIIVNALAPDTRGEILALVSGPSYDPTRFDDKAYYATLHDNSRRPELNRTLGAKYPPGSTFKIVTLAAALQTGTTTMNSAFYCPGSMTLGKTNQVFHCHERVSGHGSLGTAKALAESCDVAFYKMGLRLSDSPEDTLATFARYFGYGSPVGIDLPGEVRGNVPDGDWKKRVWHENWYGGDTANYSIGQGFLQVSPLQDLWAASIVAWDGMRYPTRLLLSSKGEQGMRRTEQQPGEATLLDPAVLENVKSAMRLTATDGTCRKLDFDPRMQVCAKTGSAEVGKNRRGHSWVVGFYPKDQPRYGFICFFENAGESGDAAIPAAVALLKYLNEADPLGRPKPDDTATGQPRPAR